MTHTDETPQHNSLHRSWFRAALAVNGVLGPSKIFAPSSDVRIGRAPFNEFVVRRAPWRSLLVISSGTTLHLLPQSEVRMGREGGAARVVTYDPGQPSIAVTSNRVKHCVAEDLTMFVHYDADRQQLERQERARLHWQRLAQQCEERLIHALPERTTVERTRAAQLLADVITTLSNLARGEQRGDAIEAQRELLAASPLAAAQDDAVVELVLGHLRVAGMVASGADGAAVQQQSQNVLAAFGLRVERAEDPGSE